MRVYNYITVTDKSFKGKTVMVFMVDQVTAKAFSQSFFGIAEVFNKKLMKSIFNFVGTKDRQMFTVKVFPVNCEIFV